MAGTRLMTERITLRGLRIYGHHGLGANERRDGQEFVVDLVVWADLAAAARSDAVTDTLDYGELACSAARVVAGPARNLIETVAAEVAERLLAEPRAEQVEVTVHKPAAPIAATFDDVAVTVRRSRASHPDSTAREPPGSR
jgi:dihydroneopterin aldolase